MSWVRQMLISAFVHTCLVECRTVVFALSYDTVTGDPVHTGNTATYLETALLVATTVCMSITFPYNKSSMAVSTSLNVVSHVMQRGGSDGTI
jgi:hypothetical protein